MKHFFLIIIVVVINSCSTNKIVAKSSLGRSTNSSQSSSNQFKNHTFINSEINFKKTGFIIPYCTLAFSGELNKCGKTNPQLVEEMRATDNMFHYLTYTNPIDNCNSSIKSWQCTYSPSDSKEFNSRCEKGESEFCIKSYLVDDGLEAKEAWKNYYNFSRNYYLLKGCKVKSNSQFCDYTNKTDKEAIEFQKENGSNLKILKSKLDKLLAVSKKADFDYEKETKKAQVLSDKADKKRIVQE